MQELGDVQDTPCSTLWIAPDGLGVGSITQLVPSQRSANVTSVLLLL
jgi:hypothetical protein